MTDGKKSVAGEKTVIGGREDGSVKGVVGEKSGERRRGDGGESRCVKAGGGREVGKGG